MKFRLVSLGLSLFMIGALTVSWLVYATLRRDIQGPTSRFTALFTDTMGLHPGDDVRVAGVRVGRVDAIELDGFNAKVTFRIQADQLVYSDTMASVTYQNVIGQRYLSLAAGAQTDRRQLLSGSQIPLVNTSPSFDISALLNGYEPLLTVLDPQKVDDLTSAIVKALQGDSGTLLTLINATSELAGTFAGPDEVLGKTIEQVNEVTSNLARQTAELQTTITQTRDILDTLDVRRDSLLTSMGSIDSAVSRLSVVANSISPDLHALLSRDAGFLAHMSGGDGRDRFAYLAANIPFALKGLARISQEGAYVNAYACNINITIFAVLGRLIPSIVEHATPGGRVQQSAICR